MLQQIGRPKEVYNAPANLFVAGFIGSPPMNFVAGGIEDGRFRAEAVDIALGGSAKPGPATLGFRTEDAAIVEPGTGRFDGRVYAAEMTGEQTLVTVERGESTLSIKMPKDFEVDFDSVVGVGFPAEHGFLFDTESGARLEAAIAPD